MPSAAVVFEQLMETITDRKRNPPPKSYTTHLFSKGTDGISAKVSEECTEVIEAARCLDQEPENREARSHVIYEAGDLVYHLFVLLGYHDISLEELGDELRRRFGTSGIDEKASRRRDGRPGES